VNYTFLLHWVRRISVREVIGDLGTRLRSPLSAFLQISVEGDFRLVRSTDAVGRPRLRVFRTTGIMHTNITAAAPIPGLANADPLLTTLFQQTTVRDAVYELVPQCLKTQFERTCGDICSQTGDRDPLLDVSFANTESGLKALAQAGNGDFTAIFDGCTSRTVPRYIISCAWSVAIPTRAITTQAARNRIGLSWIIIAVSGFSLLGSTLHSPLRIPLGT